MELDGYSNSDDPFAFIRWDLASEALFPETTNTLAEQTSSCNTDIEIVSSSSSDDDRDETYTPTAPSPRLVVMLKPKPKTVEKKKKKKKKQEKEKVVGDKKRKPTKEKAAPVERVKKPKTTKKEVETQLRRSVEAQQVLIDKMKQESTTLTAELNECKAHETELSRRVEELTELHRLACERIEALSVTTTTSASPQQLAIESPVIAVVDDEPGSVDPYTWDAVERASDQCVVLYGFDAQQITAMYRHIADVTRSQERGPANIQRWLLVTLHYYRQCVPLEEMALKFGASQSLIARQLRRMLTEVMPILEQSSRPLEQRAYARTLYSVQTHTGTVWIHCIHCIETGLVVAHTTSTKRNDSRAEAQAARHQPLCATASDHVLQYCARMRAKFAMSTVDFGGTGDECVAAVRGLLTLTNLDITFGNDLAATCDVERDGGIRSVAIKPEIDAIVIKSESEDGSEDARPPIDYKLKTKRQRERRELTRAMTVYESSDDGDDDGGAVDTRLYTWDAVRTDNTHCLALYGFTATQLKSMLRELFVAMEKPRKTGKQAYRADPLWLLLSLHHYMYYDTQEALAKKFAISAAQVYVRVQRVAEDLMPVLAKWCKSEPTLRGCVRKSYFMRTQQPRDTDLACRAWNRRRGQYGIWVHAVHCASTGCVLDCVIGVEAHSPEADAQAKRFRPIVERTEAVKRYATRLRSKFALASRPLRSNIDGCEATVRGLLTLVNIDTQFDNPIHGDACDSSDSDV